MSVEAGRKGPEIYESSTRVGPKVKRALPVDPELAKMEIKQQQEISPLAEEPYLHFQKVVSALLSESGGNNTKMVIEAIDALPKPNDKG